VVLARLHEMLQHAMNTPGSDAVPLLQQQISEAAARKEWLFDQIQRMEKAGALEPTPRRRRVRDVSQEA
jgi:hypothetical protein